MSSQHNTARPVKDLDVADLLNVLPCYLICHDIVCIAYIFGKLVLMTAQAGLPLKTEANQRGVWTPREASVMLSDIAKLVILLSAIIPTLTNASVTRSSIWTSQTNGACGRELGKPLTHLRQLSRVTSKALRAEWYVQFWAPIAPLVHLILAVRCISGGHSSPSLQQHQRSQQWLLRASLRISWSTISQRAGACGSRGGHIVGCNLVGRHCERDRLLP
jgi:hypothetical protein